MTLLILCELIQGFLGEPWNNASLSLFVSMLLECWETHHTEHGPAWTEDGDI